MSKRRAKSVRQNESSAARALRLRRVVPDSDALSGYVLVRPFGWPLGTLGPRDQVAEQQIADDFERMMRFGTNDVRVRMVIRKRRPSFKDWRPEED